MIKKYAVFSDRIVSALSYLSAGWVGVIYLVLMYFLKKNVSKYLKFNILQAIFLALAYFVLSVGLRIICSILLHIPFIRLVVSQIQFLLNRPFILGYSFVQFCILVLVIYLVFMCLCGKYPRLYKVSEIIDANVR